MHAMPIRRMAFGFGDSIDPYFFGRDPLRSYTSHAYWMTLPYLEPYVMRSVRAAIDEVRDPALKEDMRRFCAQEGQHFQQHAKANDLLRAHRPGFEALRAIEADLEADYRRFTATKSLRWNLAYAEGFEAMTMALSRAQMELRVQDDMEGPLRDLFLWHIMEELEHRTVAFDALHAVGGGYVYRMIIGAWARKHFLGYVQRFLACFMAQDAEAFANVPDEVQRDRKVKMEALVARSKPYLMQALMPWYNPSKVQMPAEFESIRAHYSGLAVSIG
jgi:predicted metal-dependent hydrolase